MALFWPVLLVVLANTFYNICTKATPQGVSPFASLAVTYLVASLCSLIFFFLSNPGKSLIGEAKLFNWTTFVLGVIIIGLEFGYIRMYRAGWNISVGSLVANISLAVVLVVIGVLLYHESLSARQVLGMALCVAGLIFINWK